MIEDIIFEAIQEDEELRAKIKSQVAKVINSENFVKALEKNIVKTIENMDFDDLLCDLINDEDLFEPLIISIKNKLKKVLN